MTAMMLVSLRMRVLPDRERADEKARQLVTETYREACRIRVCTQEAFDAALKSYTTAFSHVNRELAGRAVAHILATSEMGA
jgi:hypothetical protein